MQITGVKETGLNIYYHLLALPSIEKADSINHENKIIKKYFNLFCFKFMPLLATIISYVTFANGRNISHFFAKCLQHPSTNYWHHLIDIKIYCIYYHIIILPSYEQYISIISKSMIQRCQFLFVYNRFWVKRPYYSWTTHSERW